MTEIDTDFPRDAEGVRLIKNVRPETRLTHPWADDCFVQGGGGPTNRITTEERPDRAFFVEVAPRNPNTFIRGEGRTIVDAETAAWAKFQKVSSCATLQATGQHKPETRGYTNGAGFCSDCGMFMSKAFTLQEIGSVCVICGEDYYGTYGDLMACERHSPPSYGDFADLRWEAESKGAAPVVPEWAAPMIGAPGADFSETYRAYQEAAQKFVETLRDQPEDVTAAMVAESALIREAAERRLTEEMSKPLDLDALSSVLKALAPDATVDPAEDES